MVEVPIEMVGCLKSFHCIMDDKTSGWKVDWYFCRIGWLAVLIGFWVTEEVVFILVDKDMVVDYLFYKMLLVI